MQKVVKTALSFQNDATPVQEASGAENRNISFSTPGFTETTVSIWCQNAHSQHFLPSSRSVTVPVPPLTSCHAAPASRPVLSRIHARREPSPTPNRTKKPRRTPPPYIPPPHPGLPPAAPWARTSGFAARAAPARSLPRGWAHRPAAGGTQPLTHLAAPGRPAAGRGGGGGGRSRGGAARPPAGSPRGAAAPGSPCPRVLRGHGGQCRAGRGRVSAPAPRGRRRPSQRRRRPPPAAGPMASGLPASCRTAPQRAPLQLLREQLRITFSAPARTSGGS